MAATMLHFVIKDGVLLFEESCVHYTGVGTIRLFPGVLR